MFKGVWVDYSEKLWELDRDFTIWIFNKDLPIVINQGYNYIMKHQSKNRIHLYSNKLRYYLHKIRKFNEETVQLKRMSKTYSEIPKQHKYFNNNTSIQVDYVKERIRCNLPPKLQTLLIDKYSTWNLTAVYIEEYIRFMTLIYFSNSTLTPSEEVDKFGTLINLSLFNTKDFASMSLVE